MKAIVLQKTLNPDTVQNTYLTAMFLVKYPLRKARIEDKGNSGVYYPSAARIGISYRPSRLITEFIVGEKTTKHAYWLQRLQTNGIENTQNKRALEEPTVTSNTSSKESSEPSYKKMRAK